MRIRRSFLFWGLFFILLGAIPVVARLGWVDPDRLGDFGRLWPLILVAMGLAILVSRTRAGPVGIVLAAVVLGSIGGVALASGHLAILEFGDCAPGNAASLQHSSRNGTFLQPATVSMRLNCGEVNLSTIAGQTWTLDGSYRDEPPVVSSSSSGLWIQAPEGTPRHQEWTVSVPFALVRDLEVTANAGSATLDVTGASLDKLRVEGNAGDVLVYAPDASIGDLQVSVNAGRARLTLGASASGVLSVNAGSIDVCTPPTADLLFDVPDHFAFATNLGQAGLTHSGSGWQRAGSGSTSVHLRIDGNAGSFTLNPIGGCR